MTVTRFSPVFLSLLLLSVAAVTNIYQEYFEGPEPRDLVFLKCDSDDYENAALLLWDGLNFELANISNASHWERFTLPLEGPNFFIEHFFYFEETWADANTRTIGLKKCNMQCFEVDRVSLEATMKTIGRKDSAFNCESISESDATELYAQQVNQYLSEEAAEKRVRQDEVEAFKI